MPQHAVNIMAEANIFLIFNRPQIARELYDSFKEFDDLMNGTMIRIQNAWEEFQGNADRSRLERMQCIETVFLPTLLDWQELSSRAQEKIGHGNPINFQDIYEQFGVQENDVISVPQLRRVESEFFELMGITREILVHASTRIADENEQDQQ